MKFSRTITAFSLLAVFSSYASIAPSAAQQIVPLKPPQQAPQTPQVQPPAIDLPDPWANDGSQKPSTNAKPATRAQPEQGFTKAPQTPEEISDYLRKMRKIIDTYNGSVARILQNPAAVAADPSKAAAAVPDTQRLAGQINGLIPPKELTASHAKLAAMMQKVDSFISGGFNSLDSLMTATALVTQLEPTFSAYHREVLQVISAYNIDPSLDPFGGEDQATKNQFASGMDNFQQQKINSILGGAAGAGSAGAGGAGGGLGGMDMSGVTNMLGGAGGGNFADLFKGSGGGSGGAGNGLFNGDLFGKQGDSGAGASGGFGSAGAGLGGLSGLGSSDGNSGDSGTAGAADQDPSALINTLQKMLGGSGGSLNGLLGQ